MAVKWSSDSPHSAWHALKCQAPSFSHSLWDSMRSLASEAAIVLRWEDGALETLQQNWLCKSCAQGNCHGSRDTFFSSECLIVDEGQVLHAYLATRTEHIWKLLNFNWFCPLNRPNRARAGKRWEVVGQTFQTLECHLSPVLNSKASWWYKRWH